jgi:hypothetical protein
MAKNKTTIFSPIEKEVIFLKAVNELINSMVNYMPKFQVPDWVKEGLNNFSVEQV